MAQFNLDAQGRPEPLTISIKVPGDSIERFQSRTGSLVTFNSANGEGVTYESKVTDGNGETSTVTFQLSCQRPPDCDAGPTILDLVSFDKTRIIYRYAGVNVPRIRRDIINNNVIVDSRIDEPSTDLVESPFLAPLAAGNYVVRIQGESCYSPNPSGREFVLTDDDNTVQFKDGFPRFYQDPFDGKFYLLVALTKDATLDIEIRDEEDNLISAGSNAVFSTTGAVYFSTFTEGIYNVKIGILEAQVSTEVPDGECVNGPHLISATSLSSTQTQFLFDAEDVTTLEWFILNVSSQIVAQGVMEPTWNTMVVSHSPLSGGTYTFKINALNCINETGAITEQDFTVAGSALSLSTISVSQLSDGRYQLVVSFSGGSPNYSLLVRSQSNVTIGTYPNTTGSPATITLPIGTAPQTVKLRVEDSQSSQVENTSVVLPAPTPKLNFVQADDFISLPTKTPMTEDGSNYFIRTPANFNWDVEFVLPNGGLWDYIEKRARKRVSGNWVEKNISGATGNPQNYAVSASSGSERMFLPRNGQGLVIDSVNVFKTAAEWEFRFIARKGGASGAIVGQVTRVFTVTAPPTLSGITLFNRNGSTLGSSIQELNTVGDIIAKPTPQYDFAVTGFNGNQFDRIYAVYRLKVGNSYVQKFDALLNFGSLKTSITASDFSLFKVSQDVGTSTEIFTQGDQAWQIEFIGYNGGLSAANVVGSKKAEFNFVVGTSNYTSPGKQRKVASGREFYLTNGLDFGVEVLSSGNVRLYHPATRNSLNGTSVVYPWVYDNHVRLDATELAAFRSPTGLNFPNGKHTISIKWHSAAVANYDDVIDGGGAGSPYWLAGEQLNVSGGYSAMDDYFTFSILPSSVTA